MVKVETIVVGELQTNSYLVFDDKEAILIDPGAQPDKILSYLEKYSLNLKFIVNTHGHFDHIAGNDKIAEKMGAEVLISSEDALMLSDPEMNLSFEKEILKKPDRILIDNDIIEAGNIKMKVISTPGHTRGSISLLFEDKIFCGDTVFAEGGVGRTDLPGGDSKMLIQSIKKLLQFPEKTRLYPGHGPETTVGEVKIFLASYGI
jgi:glyoxylase-like metal-dependent hydrolase (beta-lactamase superfamily II)